LGGSENGVEDYEIVNVSLTILSRFASSGRLMMHVYYFISEKNGVGAY